MKKKVNFTRVIFANIYFRLSIGAMSKDNAIFFQLCKQLYPNEFRNRAKRILTGLLPHLNERIHSYRHLDDLEVDLDVVKSLLGYTSDEKRNDVLERLIIHRDHSGIAYTNQNKIHSDKQIMKVAVAMIPHCLVFADEKLQDDQEIVRLALRSGEMLCAASERLRDDKDLVRLAVSSAGPYALRYASLRLKSDAKLIIEASNHPETEQSYLDPFFHDPISWTKNEIYCDLILSLRQTM